MNKIILIISLIFGLCVNTLFSQNLTKDFKISLPEHKIQKSCYSSIDYIDSRIDTLKMGIIQRGAFNRKAKVISKVPLSIQLKNVMHSLTDSSANNGELLFQLRQLTFAEITGAMSEKGYCRFKAELYSKNNYQYQKLASIDTLILIKSMDVTKALFKSASKTITDFIANSLLKEPIDSNCYSFKNIQEIDSIEKREIKVYNTDTYMEGLYYNYQSFSCQKPDKQASIEVGKDGRISRVKISNTESKMIKIKPKDIYAIVYNGKPYVTTKFGYFPLQKSKGDFYFVGRTKVSANSGDIVAASMFFGVIGSLLASNANATFVMMLDHNNGGFIHIREVRNYL